MGKIFGHKFRSLEAKSTPPLVEEVSGIRYYKDEVINVISRLTKVEYEILCKRCGSKPIEGGLNDERMC